MKKERFIYRYKIAIILGGIMALGVCFCPTDYTYNVNELNEQIKKLEQDIQERESKYIKEVNAKLDQEIQKIAPQKEELNIKLKELNEIKEPLQIEYDKLIAEQKVAAEEEAKIRKAEEEERRKGKWVIESNGYNVWEAYLTPGTYQVSVEHKGRGNCIVHAGDRSDQEQILVINEIGKGTFAGTFKVKSEGFYTLTFKTDSGFSFEFGLF